MVETLDSVRVSGNFHAAMGTGFAALLSVLGLMVGRSCGALGGAAAFGFDPPFVVHLDQDVSGETEQSA